MTTENNGSTNQFMENILPLFIPIIAIVMSLSLPMLFIYLHYRKQKEIYTLYHQQRMAAIEKGIELPPMPAGFLEGAPSRRRDLLRGLIWLFVGVAVTVAVFQSGKHREAFFGLIPIGIGLAYLIYYGVEGRRESEPPKIADGNGIKRAA